MAVNANEHAFMARTLLRQSLDLISSAVDNGTMTIDEAAVGLVETAVSVRAHLMIAAAEAVA